MLGFQVRLDLLDVLVDVHEDNQNQAYGGDDRAKIAHLKLDGADGGCGLHVRRSTLQIAAQGEDAGTHGGAKTDAHLHAEGGAGVDESFGADAGFPLAIVHHVCGHREYAGHNGAHTEAADGDSHHDQRQVGVRQPHDAAAQDHQHAPGHHQLALAEPLHQGGVDEVGNHGGDGLRGAAYGDQIGVLQHHVAEEGGGHAARHHEDVRDQEQEGLEIEVLVFQHAGKGDIQRDVLHLDGPGLRVLTDMLLAEEEADQEHHHLRHAEDHRDRHPAHGGDQGHGDGVDDQGGDLGHDKADGRSSGAVLHIQRHAGEQRVVGQVVGGINQAIHKDIGSIDVGELAAGAKAGGHGKQESVPRT